MGVKYQKWNSTLGEPSHWQSLCSLGISPLSALLLCARGVDSQEKFQAFDRATLHDPHLLQDMDKAVARIWQALTKKEKIAIYGDYDVDGITSTALLTHYLQSLGGDVISYIPHRMEEGYGLNQEAVDILAQEGVALIVTVDCGITATKEVVHAHELGMEVIVTDHHTCPDVLPQGAAVVNPHRPHCPYPFKKLAGVGVALKLALALGGKDQQELILSCYADLVALGTVADVMELLGENRTLVRLGLAKMKEQPRAGILALMEEAKVSLASFTSTTIGFTLAPRLNAAGRMGGAEIAVRLLLTEDLEEARYLAAELCALNRFRQETEGKILEQSMAMAEAIPKEQRHALVLAQEGWHQGVVGIVASRLVEKYHCPTFMISLQDGQGKGSCRSFGDIHLFQGLESCSHLLKGFGGHAMAAGFTIEQEHIQAFSQYMNRYVSNHTQGQPQEAVLTIDCEIPHISLLDIEGVEGLSALEPFGNGNSKPIFSLSGCTIVALSDVGGGKHLKLRISANGASMDAIFFGVNQATCGLSMGDRIDVAFTPQINEFRGRRSVQLLVCDLRPAQTRMESEQALYEKYQGGQPLSSMEAAALLPTRDDFAVLWRYLKGRTAAGPIEETPPRLARNVARGTGQRETLVRTMICLEVLDERGLISLSRT